MSWFSDFKDDVVNTVQSVPVVGPVVAATSGFFTGGVSGASVATGGDVNAKTLTVDAAGLAAGTGLAWMGADPLAGYVVDPVTGDVTTAGVVNDPLAGYVVNPNTGDVVPVGSAASGGSTISASSILKGTNTALDGVIKLAAVNNILKSRNAAQSGQRSDVSPLASTWGFPGQPLYANDARGAYVPSGSASILSGGLLLPMLAILAGVVLLVLFIRR